MTNQTKESKISLRDGPLDEENSYKTTRNEKSIDKGKGNSKISEWLKPEPEIIEEDSNKNII